MAKKLEVQKSNLEVKNDKDRILEGAKSILQKQVEYFSKDQVAFDNWEIGFMTIGYGYSDVNFTKKLFRKLFDSQWANGFIPHQSYHKNKGAWSKEMEGYWKTNLSPYAPKSILSSGVGLPPFQAVALWRFYQSVEDKSQVKSLLEEYYPKLLAWHRYLYTSRDPWEEGLVYIHHPVESTMSNAVVWDVLLDEIGQQEGHKSFSLTEESLVKLFQKYQYDDRLIYKECPFLVQDPFFNGILSWANECLIKIGHLLGKDVAQILEWHELTIYAMNEKLWDEEAGLYRAFDLNKDQHLPGKSIASLLPMAGEVPTQDQAESLLNHLESKSFGGDNQQFHLCASYDLNSDQVAFHDEWRGPVWLITNWMLYQGVLRYDFDELSMRIFQDSMDLIAIYDFHQYFDARKDPVQHLGLGSPEYLPTAALYIDLLFHDGLEV